jgi:hypothetical protein
MSQRLILWTRQVRDFTNRNVGLMLLALVLGLALNGWALKGRVDEKLGRPQFPTVSPKALAELDRLRKDNAKLTDQSARQTRIIMRLELRSDSLTQLINRNDEEGTQRRNAVLTYSDQQLASELTNLLSD